MPFPAPTSTMSRKMPTVTAKPVMAVRNLLRLNVPVISSSRSCMIWIFVFDEPFRVECSQSSVAVVLNLLDESVFEVYNAVGVVGHAAFVGYQDDGHAFVVELAEDVHHFHTGFTVQCSRRFV